MLKKYLTVWVFEQPFHGVVTGERYSYKEIPKKYQNHTGNYQLVQEQEQELDR